MLTTTPRRIHRHAPWVRRLRQHGPGGRYGVVSLFAPPLLSGTHGNPPAQSVCLEKEKKTNTVFFVGEQ